MFRKIRVRISIGLSITGFIAVFGCSECVADSDIFTTRDPANFKGYSYLAERMRGALVRITLIPLDPIKGEIVSASEFGFGVRLSKSGLVLTAAHVCFPYSDRAEGDYTLHIEEWNSEKEAWKTACTLVSGDLPKLVLTSAMVSTNLGRVALGYDSKQLVPRERDFAFLRTCARNGPFMDVVGEYGVLASLRAKLNGGATIFCTSDFTRKLTPQVDHQALGLRHSEAGRDYELKAKETGTEFKGGNSGSPLVLFCPKESAIFVLGVVVRASVEEGAKQECSAVLIPEILNEVLSPQHHELMDFLWPLAEGGCAWPSDDRALLESLVFGFAPTTPPKTRTDIAKCFYPITTWEGTGGAMEASDGFNKTVQQNSGPLGQALRKVGEASLERTMARVPSASKHNIVLTIFGGKSSQAEEIKKADKNFEMAVAEQQKVTSEVRRVALEPCGRLDPVALSGASEYLDALMLPYSRERVWPTITSVPEYAAPVGVGKYIMLSK